MSDFVLLRKPIFWLAVFLSLLIAVVSQWPRPEVTIVFCNVGQGDAALVSYKSVQVLIDGGPGAGVLDCLAGHMPFWDRKIEIVILSHPQVDHFGGLINVFERYGVGEFVAVGRVEGQESRRAGEKDDSSTLLLSRSSTLMKFQDVVANSHAKIIVPQKGDLIKVGDLSLLFLWPTTKIGDISFWKGESLAGMKDVNSVLGEANFITNVNEFSVATEINFGNFKALFTGDLTSEEEDQLGVGDIDILKVSHHGSKFSSGEEFLKKIKPELAVISVGKNSYGHPTGEVLARLKSLRIKYLRTDRDGEVMVRSDGENWQLGNR